MPAEFRPAYYDSSMVRYGSIPAWADAVFGGGLSKGEFSDANADPPSASRRAFTEHSNNVLLPQYLSVSDELTPLYKDYMQGQM